MCVMNFLLDCLDLSKKIIRFAIYYFVFRNNK
jgi:hypothetical protein